MEILDDQLHSVQDDKPSLEELKQNGYSFNFSQYWDNAMTLFKECWGWIGLYILILGVVGNIIGFIPGGSVIWSPISGAMIAGITCHGLAVLQGNKADFGTFFNVFQRFGPLLVYQLILMLIFVPFFIPTILELMDSGLLEILSSPTVGIDIQDDPAIVDEMIRILTDNAPLFAIGVSLYLLVRIFTYLVNPMIVVGNLGVMDAIKMSFSLVSKNFFSVLGYSIVAGLFSIVGVLACGIGAIFTAGFVELAKLGMYSELTSIQPQSQNLSEVDL